MAIARIQTSTVPNTQPRQKRFADQWFFTVVASAMIALCLVAFLPSLVHTNARRAPLSLLAIAHGIVFSGWLLLFLVQSMLISTKRVAVHRTLGWAGAFLIALMLPVGYATTAEMIRRGFDLSGDLRIDYDARPESIFAFNDLLVFGVLAIAALAYRRKPAIHKRLMLFADIVLMPAPLAHLIGHTPWLAAMPAAIVMVPISLFVVAAVARDFLMARRVHPLTWMLAIIQLISGPLEAGVIGPSAAWRSFASWLAN